jgi:hypothetical protein
MTTEAIEQASSNFEAVLLAISDAREAERVVLLWDKPFLPDPEIPDALQVPTSVWAQIKADGDGPPLFLLGRRLFVKTSDLRLWLDKKAAGGRPGSKRLRSKVEKRET